MLSYKAREIRTSVDASSRATDSSGHVQVTGERVLRQSAIPIYTYKIAQVYPHDRTLYTQGLVVESGSVYEGTGLYGQSKLGDVPAIVEIGREALPTLSR